MSNENYVNHYVEIMADTLKEQVLQNISLKANARITEGVIKNLQDTITEYDDANKGLAEEVDELKSSLSNTENERIKELVVVNDSLNSELAVLRSEKVNFDNVKNQVQHIDTFRNELEKERQEHQKTRENYGRDVTELKMANENSINELNKKYEKIISELNETIEYLRLTPAKRKKIDEAKGQQSTVDVFEPENNNVRDGGSF